MYCYLLVIISCFFSISISSNRVNCFRSYRRNFISSWGFSRVDEVPAIGTKTFTLFLLILMLKKDNLNGRIWHQRGASSIIIVCARRWATLDNFGRVKNPQLFPLAAFPDPKYWKIWRQLIAYSLNILSVFHIYFQTKHGYVLTLWHL